MAKFHINPQTGNPGRCRAETGNCPYGSEDEHYNSSKEARSAYEREQSEVLMTHKKNVSVSPLAKKAEYWNKSIAVSSEVIEYAGGSFKVKFTCGECGYENKAKGLFDPPTLMYFRDPVTRERVSTATCRHCKKDNVFSNGRAFMLDPSY